MPKAQFDDVLQASEGLVTVSGPFTPDGAAEPHASAGQIHIHWVVAQGTVVSEGLDELSVGSDGKWKAQAVDPTGWQPGPAQAAGVIVTVHPRSTSGADAVLEVFTWTQPVKLEVDGLTQIGGEPPKR